ncbi:MAG: hypothetical protein ACQEQ7_01175 [Thermodesulfobacteriota bacterium]
MNWLDRGELDKLIERSAPQQSPPRDRNAYHDRSRSYGKDDYHYKKKKHNGLGDVWRSLWGLPSKIEQGKGAMNIAPLNLS